MHFPQEIEMVGMRGCVWQSKENCAKTDVETGPHE